MKTAGTTFGRQLKLQFGERQIFPCAGLEWAAPGTIEAYNAYLDMSTIGALTPERVAEIRVYTGHFPFMATRLVRPRPVTLTLLREPVERSLAALRHFKRHPRYCDLSLTEIYEDPTIFDFYVANHQTKVFSLSPDDGESSILCTIEIDDRRFEQAVCNLETIDVLGLTESYAAFIDEVRSRLGWWPDGVNLNWRANASHEGWEADEGLRERIAADNAYDIQLYERARALVGRPGDRR